MRCAYRARHSPNLSVCSWMLKRRSRSCLRSKRSFPRPARPRWRPIRCRRTIQMRFNELLAGVRGDIAVMVFGDEFEPMLHAANQIAAALRSTQGATDVKVEQINGLPTLDIAINRREIARLGLSVTAIQSVIGAAIGGQEAGIVFEGDRRFEIVVKLPEDRRADLEVLRNLPVTLPPLSPGAVVQTVPLSRVADFHFVEGPNQISREQGKRRVVVTANVRGRDMAAVVDEAKSKIDQSVKLPPGYWMTWGGL